MLVMVTVFDELVTATPVPEERVTPPLNPFIALTGCDHDRTPEVFPVSTLPFDRGAAVGKTSEYDEV